MEAVDVGIWSILPPIIAIVLALITKEVFSSLLIGAFAGTLIYSGGHVMNAVTSLFELMVEKMGDNGFIVIFLALLGALVAVVTLAGGSFAYGQWARRKIKKRSTSLLATSFLGALIFIDDYFNCLTVGTVMKPVTDNQRVSRAKLAYIIDATAAPICIIAPVSSWAVAVASQITEAGGNGMQTFVQAIPYNLYAILTIVMIVVLSIFQRDMGLMRKHELRALETGNLHDDAGNQVADSELEKIEGKPNGKVWDLVIPIVALIVLSIAAMLYLGGYGTTLADGTRVSIAAAFGETDASKALTLGGFGALIVALLLFVPRKRMSFKEFFNGVLTGFKSMIGAITILVLAWTLSGVCRDLLQTGVYVGNVVAESAMPLWILPAIIFVVACLLAFATGTSWGTFGILIPIVMEIISRTDPSLMLLVIGATLAGAVYGDHCSPISDTTILSATGAGCDLLTHVSTQAPYATIVAGICTVGYLVCGYFNNLIAMWAVSLVLLLVILFTVFKPTKGKAADQPQEQ